MPIVINTNLKFAGNDRMQLEFTYIKKYLKGKGIDCGCGTNRVSQDILAIDKYDYKRSKDHTEEQRKNGNDIVHNCHDLNLRSAQFKGQEYTFNNNSFDFIFSSHCLEDFEDIPIVFLNWWQKLKPNGYMILLLPDMENGRYPKCDDPQGNPSHRTDIGSGFMKGMLQTLKFLRKLEYEIIQIDTIPHNESCTLDIVIQKKEVI